jgi:CelD/BcsL family acetyltransferase involved in cellulose biosynthesis
MSALTTRQWSVEEWLGNEATWSALLSRTSADPLYLSWRWLTLWWQHYGDRLNLTANILAIYRGETLVGLAPFYLRSVVRARFVRARSVQLMGLAWRDSVPLISEYLDVIAAAEDVDEVRDECARVLLDQPEWTELVIGFTSAAAKWRAAVEKAAGPGRIYTRELDRSVSYHADLRLGFAPYLKELGQSTRRSIWNLRRRLSEEHGAVSFEFLAAEEIADGFADLNRLHELRWKRPAFPGERLQFHAAYAVGLAANGELAFSRLRVAGKVVSVLYDIRKGTVQYNMKMGFDPDFSTRLSLGLVHFGYAMEAAAERGVTVYDFLAGPGQSFDFKRNLGQLRRELSSVQFVRGGILPAIYRLRDRIR